MSARKIGRANDAERASNAQERLMSGAEYLAALVRVGFTISSAARFFRVSVRRSQAWTVEGPPPPVAVALLLMIGAGITAERADALVGSVSVPRAYPRRGRRAALARERAAGTIA